MSEAMYLLEGLTPLGLGIVALAAVGSVVWLIGLVVVTRGTTPRERPSILRAYGAAQPRARRLFSRASEFRPGNGGTDVGSIAEGDE